MMATTWRDRVSLTSSEVESNTNIGKNVSGIVQVKGNLAQRGERVADDGDHHRHGGQGVADNNDEDSDVVGCERVERVAFAGHCYWARIGSEGSCMVKLSK